MGFSKHLRCDQLVEIASDYLERALAADDAEQLEQHLLICSDCARYVSQLRQIQERTRKLAELDAEPLDPASEERLLSLLRRFKGQGAGLQTD